MMLKKEHLLHYMLKGHVHLSKKDYGFFNNLTYMIKEKNQVTSNQNKLFDKLIVKYQRQLRKIGHKIEELQKLDWDAKLIESSEHYLVPRLYLEDGDLCLRTPFNSKLIKSFQTSINNTFNWDNKKRVYISKFYTHALRLAYDLCNSHFDKLELSDEIKELLKDVWVYEGVNLAPILCVDEGKYYIKNTNKNLSEAIKDIELNNDPYTLFQLNRHGITISDDIINNDPILRFASNFYAHVDVDMLMNNPDFFVKLGINKVCAPIRYLHRGSVKEDLINFLRKINVEIYNTLDSFDGECIYLTGMNTAISTLEYSFGKACKRITKIVMLNNSRPIEVR